MAYRINFRPLLAAVFAMAVLVSCSKLSDTVDAARTSVQNHLNGKGIYNRANVPENPSRPLVGYYDVIGGAFRWVTNESTRSEREDQRIIEKGDRVEFYFEAYIYSSNYESPTSLPYFTNIYNTIISMGVNNQDFDASEWSTDPLIIEVGYDTQILNSIQNTLPSCMAGDEITIFLPPDVGYGNRQVGIVPGKSTLVFKLTELNIIE